MRKSHIDPYTMLGAYFAVNDILITPLRGSSPFARLGMV